MGEMVANSEGERFQSSAEKYANYLQTFEGRLRLDLAFANLQEFLARATQPLRVLDVGGGPGALAVRLARLGHHVTLLDSSHEMLDMAQSAARDAGVVDKVELRQGDGLRLAEFFSGRSFDLILCHNVLEFVEEPEALLRCAPRVMSDSSILSVLVRNQAGEALKATLLTGDLAAAERTLTAEWGDESLYGGKVRLFAPEGLQSMLAAASLAVSAVRGVRVVSDYLPPKVQRDDEYERIVELERRLGRRADFAAVARYTQCLAHRIGPVPRDGV
jgi:S-adenosylmethionine-dependent methyltransferase